MAEDLENENPVFDNENAEEVQPASEENAEENATKDLPFGQRYVTSVPGAVVVVD
jgi:hypothetical protein